MIGAPSGVLYDLCNSIHAEENAIMQAGKERCLGNVIYVTGIDFTEENNLFYGKPCYKCESKIITARLEEIIFFNKNCKKIKDIKEENIMKLKVADVIIGRKNNPFENQEKQVTILKEKGLQFKESQ